MKHLKKFIIIISITIYFHIVGILFCAAGGILTQDLIYEDILRKKDGYSKELIEENLRRGNLLFFSLIILNVFATIVVILHSKKKGMEIALKELKDEKLKTMILEKGE